MEGQEHLTCSKVKLLRKLVLSTFLYTCESWTLTAEIEKRIQALEMRCYRRLLNISYKDHVTNEEVHNRIPEWNLSARWSNHGKEKDTRMVWPHLKMENNIKEWTGMWFGDSLRAAEDKEGWKGIVAMSSVVPRRPLKLRDWNEMRWDEMGCPNYWNIFDLGAHYCFVGQFFYHFISRLNMSLYEIYSPVCLYRDYHWCEHSSLK